jgi:DNA-binding transcriptional LysR family regulator
MLDVRRRRVLREVAVHGTIAGAATALDFTPSAVSQHVPALERETGVALVDRGPSSVVAGQAIERHARLRDPLVVALPRAHPLAGRERVPLQRLAGEDWISEGSGTSCHRVVDGACREAGFEPRLPFAGSSDYRIIQGLVAAAPRAGVERAEFFAAGVRSVHGLRLRDGRRVVVKLHGPRTKPAFLGAMQAVPRRGRAYGAAGQRLRRRARRRPARQPS